jgi:protein TonB
MRHKVAILSSVVLLHLVVLWAVHTELLVRITDLAAPVKVLLSIVPSTSQQDKQTAEPLARPTTAERTPVPSQQAFTAPPLTPPSAANPPVESSISASEKAPTTPAESTPMRGSKMAVAAGLPSTLPVQPVEHGQVPPGSQSNEAQHLYAPAPIYPPLSTRLNETGTSVLRVLVGKDGLPKKVELAQSSGFQRLDTAALQAVKEWRFVPHQENGIAVEKWYTQPIPFRFVP